MVFRIAFAAAFAFGSTSAPLHAGPDVDAMSNCLVMNTTGADRVLLIRWVLFAFASHPTVGQSVSMDTTAIDPTDQAIATLFMSLLTERCPAETKAAFVAEGPAAFEAAFTVLGQVASQELATAPEVNGAMTGFLKYIDDTKLDALLQ